MSEPPDDLCTGCVRGLDTYRDERGVLMHEIWQSDRECSVFPCRRPTSPDLSADQ